jgi:two-component sensor histidine kinase
LKQYILFFYLLISGHVSLGQGDHALMKRTADNIDSLLLSNYFSGQEQRSDALYELVKNSTEKRDVELMVQLMLQKAYIYSYRQEIGKTLELSLKALDLADKYDLPEKEYAACLMTAIAYEFSSEFHVSKKYLDRAFDIYKQNDLEHIYSTYCIRMSSYYRFLSQRSLAEKTDSAIYFAHKALSLAEKHQNKRDIIDAHLLLGILLSHPDTAVMHSLLAAKEYEKRKEYGSMVAMYNNATNTYLRHNELNKALALSDTIFLLKNTYGVPDGYNMYSSRSRIFEKIGKTDSAFLYFKKYHDMQVATLLDTETEKIKKVTEQYENDKKESIIKTQGRQMILVISLLGVIAIASVLLYRNNRKINRQNRIINKQLVDLTNTLEQKQVLLSELQHRVKNNLQHVISILEIQKESVDFNNIDELIRENQNRIHSLALLHKKLNVSDNVNEVALKKYVAELSEVVKDSYSSYTKNIQLNVACDIEKISIDKALPIGLVIVELVSNSIKHAFGKQNIGIIHIEIVSGKNRQKSKLYYVDNGIGFDINKPSEKGLGMEIIKGLIEQLDADMESSHSNGFELTLYFD